MTNLFAQYRKEVFSFGCLELGFNNFLINFCPLNCQASGRNVAIGDSKKVISHARYLVLDASIF